MSSEKTDKSSEESEKEAKEKVLELGMESERRSGVGGVFFNYCFFTEYFHAAMRRLAIEAGLRTF